MTTVGELKKFMEANNVSPEKLSQVIKISNMTIRRLLQRPEDCLLPDKYTFHFEHLAKVGDDTAWQGIRPYAKRRDS